LGLDQTLIICPLDKGQDHESSIKTEALGLCEALNLSVQNILAFTVKKINPATYLTKGHLQTVKNQVDEHAISLVYIDKHLKPGQQRDLEEFLKVKVIDRTGLILEIFADRAKTQEGRIQVDLAYKTYQKSRLVRAWTHLERQRGGSGFIGGPGEKQTELDRRALDVEIRKLEKDLEKIKANRSLQRKARERESFPIMALVGYTNAGKSTLFNYLTEEKVLSKNMLFATLDPTMRAVKLPNGQQTIISDTVGFIRNLPTELVAAFSATLEEVVEADIILHVHDINSDDYEIHRDTVLKTLESLGIDTESDNIIDVYNKIDLLKNRDEFEAKRLQNLYTQSADNVVVLSAYTGEGIDDLLNCLVGQLLLGQKACVFEIPVSDGRAISWLHTYGTVKDSIYEDSYIIMRTVLGEAAYNKFVKVFNYHPLQDSTRGSSDQ
jgi:GTP-binding protein HflX